MEELSEFVMPCHECQGGQIRLQYLTYITWLKDELITVPNFPTWVCDLCGYHEHDGRAIAWLLTLLHPPERRHSTTHARKWNQDEGPGESHQPITK